MDKPMRVVLLGFRGFPGVQGGIETHVEHLAPRLAALGCEVHAIVRSSYQHAWVGNSWHNVYFHAIWSPKNKGLETIVHTFLGILYALRLRPHLLHLQAIGPAIMTPLARMMGMRVVVTHHGPDYERQKWGSFAKLILRLGERWGMRHANARIAISEVICTLVQHKHNRACALIPNGVELPQLSDISGIIDRFGLTHEKYVLIVSRLVPEKRHPDLIEAFVKARLKDWKLVIVGSSDHPDAYTKKVLELSRYCPQVVCTGFQSGTNLMALYAHAGLFVLPSSHEGLPIAILEALSYGLPVIASDIPANTQIGLSAEHYFPLGKVEVLAERLKHFSTIALTNEMRKARKVWVASRYNWNSIAEQTLVLYKGLL
jgi:glycosyltransferase involved in cell wall biosynthesis